MQTTNGVAVKTGSGWTWLCSHCPVTAKVGLPDDAAGFDVRRWVDSIDATHYCQHKRGLN